MQAAQQRSDLRPRKEFRAVPRVLSWNVNLSLRTKWEAIAEHRPDLAVLPEVARTDLESLVPDAMHGIWIGDNDRKGLGLVSFGDYALERDASLDPKFQFFLPAPVTGHSRVTSSRSNTRKSGCASSRAARSSASVDIQPPAGRRFDQARHSAFSADSSR
jgi:hypothetical protein